MKKNINISFLLFLFICMIEVSLGIYIGYSLKPVIEQNFFNPYKDGTSFNISIDDQYVEIYTDCDFVELRETMNLLGTERELKIKLVMTIDDTKVTSESKGYVKLIFDSGELYMYLGYDEVFLGNLKYYKEYNQYVLDYNF